MPQHIIRAQQFTKQGLQRIFALADEMRATLESGCRQKMREYLSGTLMHAIFYEASTRTRFSFESAAQHLGMNVVSTDNASQFSSAVKGETLEDSIRVHAGYRPDVIVLRHGDDNAAERAARIIDTYGYTTHLINAGAGRQQHPTQAVLDAYTIARAFTTLNGLTVVMGGDLKNGRTVRSLAYLLGKFEDVKILFVSPPELRVGSDILEYLERHAIQYEQSADMHEALERADVVYWTRLQLERITDLDLAFRMREEQVKRFTIKAEHLHLLKERAIIMHPLPRMTEISTEVDRDPRARYFEQAQNGMYIRMAILVSLVQRIEI